MSISRAKGLKRTVLGRVGNYGDDMEMCLKEIINCNVWYTELLRVSFQFRVSSVAKPRLRDHGVSW